MTSQFAFANTHDELGLQPEERLKLRRIDYMRRILKVMEEEEKERLLVDHSVEMFWRREDG